jgi:hypothetical protein
LAIPNMLSEVAGWSRGGIAARLVRANASVPPATAAISVTMKPDPGAVRRKL